MQHATNLHRLHPHPHPHARWWDWIYRQWLEEGDLRLLRYLQKIERYLDARRGRPKSEQEILNLMAQIEGLLAMKYNGKYRKYDVEPIYPISTIAAVMGGCNVPLPLDTDPHQLAIFLQNNDGYFINPQNTMDISLDMHPCWILWSYIYNPKYAAELWSYRTMFIRWMTREDYESAARTLIYARSIRERTEKLPLYHPYIIRKVMYSNIDHK